MVGGRFGTVNLLNVNYYPVDVSSPIGSSSRECHLLITLQNVKRMFVCMWDHSEGVIDRFATQHTLRSILQNARRGL
jgi:hypothetical protein